MKKLVLLSFCLALTVTGNVFSASAPVKPVAAKPAVAPVKPVAPVKSAPEKAATTSAPAMPTMPPAAHVQLELVQISQAFLAEFNQAEIAQLGQVFETTLNTALASKEFDQAFVKLLNNVQEMAAVIGSNLSVCKEIQVKLNQAVAKASASFNKLAGSGMVLSQTSEFYFIKIANAILGGLKQGLAKAKPSKDVCATPVTSPEKASAVHIDTKDGKIYNDATGKQVGVQEAPGKIVMFDQKPSTSAAPAK